MTRSENRRACGVVKMVDRGVGLVVLGLLAGCEGTFAVVGRQDATVDDRTDAQIDSAPPSETDGGADAALDAVAVDAASDSVAMDSADVCPSTGCCPSPTISCSGVCTHTNTDANNCGACGVVCPDGIACASGRCAWPLLQPRLIAPLSTANVTSQSPTLHWLAPDGADAVTLQLCHDRACTTIEQTLLAMGSSGRFADTLAPGVHFWRVEARMGGVVASDWSPTWEFFVGPRSAPVDTSYGSVLDFNGDGYADVLVGSDEVWVYTGGPDGLSSTPTVLDAPAPSEGFGRVVENAGDVNGDGFGDVAIGTFETDHFYVYLGSALGLTGPPLTLTPVPGSPGAINQEIVSAGDVNGDGFGDLLTSFNDFFLSPSVTAAYVFTGSFSGPDPTPTVLHPVVPSVSTISAPDVTSAGDLNGDGFGDMVLGVNTGLVLDVETNALLVYFGRMGGVSLLPGQVIRLGAVGSVASGVGDVNGDGYCDLLMELSGPTVELYEGSATGLGTTPGMATIHPVNIGPFTSGGYSLAGAGDLNGDGYNDVVLGAPGDEAAYVIPGGATGLREAAQIAVQSPISAMGNGFGEAVALTGDVSGDQRGELLVGTDVAVAYLYPGIVGGVSTSPVILTAPGGSTGFGFRVADTRASSGTSRARTCVVGSCDGMRRPGDAELQPRVALPNPPDRKHVDFGGHRHARLQDHQPGVAG